MQYIFYLAALGLMTMIYLRKNWTQINMMLHLYVDLQL